MMIGTSGGDRPAELAEFAKFYEASVPRLVAFLVHWGLSLPDAADCVQETMIDALPPVWATLKHPYSWCRTVAHRKACDLVKRRQEEPTEEPHRAGCPLIRPGCELDDLEQRFELVYWLGRLNSCRQREVLAWTYDGATPAEIAVVLDMDPATVRSTRRNARAALRRLRAEGR